MQSLPSKCICYIPSRFYVTIYGTVCEFHFQVTCAKSTLRDVIRDVNDTKRGLFDLHKQGVVTNLYYTAAPTLDYT